VRQRMDRAAEANNAAELFDRVWSRGTYAGFSQNTSGQGATPFLDSFVRAVKKRGATPSCVVELGAGSCDHAMRCALEGFATTAVEYSAVAVTSARERLLDQSEGRLEIVQADLFAFTRKMMSRSLAGLYANSVFHFLSSHERREQYRIIRNALVHHGVLAVSFKAQGDALQKRGSVVENTPAGPVVEGEDDVRRLFVANIDVLADEMRDEGYSVQDVVRWSVPDYNIAGESGSFVGLLATG
jgi:trans-aconitate methyltransferase